jgi:hypothetical protein
VRALPVLLFDENFPPSIPRALRDLGHNAHHSREHLAAGTPDELVFEFLRKQSWDWVTHDRRVRRNPQQRAALLGAGIGAFIFTGSVQRDAREMTVFTLQCLPLILRAATVTARPFIFAITDKKKLERLD